MAIDRNKTKTLVEEINNLFNEVAGSLPGEVREKLKNVILGPAVKEIEKFVSESRPPVMFLVGRSGHGKSSLINALTNKKVAEVGDVKPTTEGSILHSITFEETYSSWDIIDSRGLFETTKPEKASIENTKEQLKENAKEQLKQDLRKYKPDIILHVIAAPETRNLEQDFVVYKKIQRQLKEELGAIPPTIIVLNKIDTIGNPRDWPPEKNARKAGLIKELLNYMSEEVLKLKYEKIDLNYPIKGYKFLKDSDYLAIIPVSSYWDDERDDRWNIETLSMFIGEHLPKFALLDFYQAQRRKKLLKNLSTSLIKRFSTIAAGIGAIPIPIADIAVLIPLQILMITLIGGLSCREFSKETALEFISAAAINVGTAFGLRGLARQLVKLIPVGGSVISAGIAYTGTYAIGKSAEAYFFEGEVKKPEEFINEKNN
ncbi:hypothetical protein BBF96_02960 [Anoxybacter fermentans]|uniref:G domain-containing protein n=1 Tax=Anoxybacter fermentans TaxID=1323375 RepID=A0A3S9SVZ5_9FIRM|nr:GTPase [Anoxybacter fermentans]AZR72442.1 hypothetical protein BBF96_02960 [Anoxybacter fermentans]